MEYKTHKDNKNIPLGCELVPFHFSGQPTTYMLRVISTGLLYSDLLWDENGKLVYSRKELRQLSKRFHREFEESKRQYDKRK